MNSMRPDLPFSAKLFFGRLFALVAVVTAIPFIYNYSGLANYGYGYSFGGLVLWLSSAVVASFFWAASYRGAKRGRASNALKVTSATRMMTRIAWIGSILYVFFVFLRRLPSGAGVFDVKGVYDAFGPNADATMGLSPLGALGAVTAPMSLLLLPYAIQSSGTRRLVLALPAIAFVGVNLLMGKRQVLMFAVFLILFSLLAKGGRVNIRRMLALFLVSMTFFATAIYFGFLRSGFGSIETQLYHNSMYLNATPVAYLAFAGLLFLYIGGGAEVLSVAADHFQPTYLPFSVTNSFLLRRINNLVDYVNYERDVAPYTSGVLEHYLGSFGRIWAGGNLQLFAEGGYIWVFFWYLFLAIWFVYLRRMQKRGRADIVDVVMFASVFLHHLFVFPLRDQLIFFAFVYYVLFVVGPRHFRFGRRGT